MGSPDGNYDMFTVSETGNKKINDEDKAGYNPRSTWLNAVTSLPAMFARMETSSL